MRKTSLRALFLTFAAPMLLCSQRALCDERPASPQKTGEIRGSVSYCGQQGNAGITVFVPGHSFQATVAASGHFILYFVPPGTYSLQLDIPGRPSHSVSGVSVADNTVTTLSTISICRDSDSDGFLEDQDCDDNNAQIHPGGEEACDGIDNNCDERVDEGCAACTDGDNDGFFAQAGCLTIVDCDDNDPTIRPTAVDLCDGKDNNCDGLVDEGFNLGLDPSNCGVCGIVCSFAHALGLCLNGECGLGPCQTGWADCNLLSGDGCEVNLLSDPANCGACGTLCSSGSCQNGQCVSCFDGIRNGDETDVDCGGSCGPCAAGMHCVMSAGCSSGVCTGGLCRAPTCIDGVKNGNETDVDCGGGCSSPCHDYKACSVRADCISGVCEDGRCSPPDCFDGVRNGNETAVDCGGGCFGCATGQPCRVDFDCASHVCGISPVCVAPTCTDGRSNGDETGVDCGGSCPACVP